ncbi:STY4851/ECs_5259 family protein [Pseudoalteromonas sp. YIC-827]|uniref:STY4851/ECs_5259 family protein n=1 Tax=Pseudoalteromonas qingdaonensis TaxID=3131913 RepID=A0ABU9MWE7_9GAMM
MNTSLLDNCHSAAHWLSSFLSSSRREQKATQPLYQLHMTQAEYLSLRLLLKSSFSIVNKTTFSKEWCGAFTLYCAEWFRREYSSDWSWRSIYETLDFELTSQQISQIVPKGLSVYWQRPLSKFRQNHSDYLGSVFREGGLPSNLLSSDANNYQKAFFSVFERYQDAKDLGPKAIDKLVRSRITSLPVTLQGDESVGLITNMAEKLDSLVYQFSLDKKDDPAQYLDEQYPRWRESFPLPLESSIGSLFLSQLLSRASKEVRKVSKIRKVLGCRHFVSFPNEAIYTEVTLPQKCRFDIRREQLQTSRIELAIFEGDNQIAALGTGFAQFEENGTFIRLRNARVRVKREKLASELYLVALQAGCKLSEVRLASSAVDIYEAPITAVKQDYEWLIISQSSITTKYKQVGLIAPAESNLSLEYGSLDDTKYKFDELKLKILVGKCRITLSTQESYVITTDSEDIWDCDFTLSGEQLPWKTTPALVFKGVPKIVRGLAKSEFEHLDEVTTCLNGHAVESLSSTELYGRQLLTVTSQNSITQLRKRIGILPNDFEVELLNGDSPTQGIIRLKTHSPCTWSVKSDDVEVVSSRRDGEVKEIVLNAKGSPPAVVTLAVQANIVSAPILIDVPFPAKGVIAYDRNNKTLARRLTVNELLGSRLHLFATQGVPAKFQVEAVLKSIQGGSASPYYRWHYIVSDKPLEVSLYGLKDSLLELLSLNEQLDGEVQLHVSGPGKNLTFTISHYSTTLEHELTKNSVFARSTKIIDSESIKPVLMSLYAPEQKPLPLCARESEGVETGEFLLPTCIESSGPWLVVPDRDSGIYFRAKFFGGSPEQVNDQQVNTLQKAAMLYHPHDNPDVISNVLNQMAENWSHSGWQYLKDTYRNYDYLPLSTFEVWRHLVRNYRALAVCLFVFENDAKFIAQIERELPVFWELIPIRHWCHAVNLMTEVLENVGISSEDVSELVITSIKTLGQSIPVFGGEESQKLLCSQQVRGLPVPIIKSMVDGWYQELLRVHREDDYWPTEFGIEIQDICLTTSTLPFELSVNMNYQTGVVYLPLLTALIASDQLKGGALEILPKDALFHLRKLRDFDREWFESVHRCFLSHFVYVINKEES